MDVIIFMLPYEEHKVYGPYKRKDGRQHIIAVKDGNKSTVSYPKYLMEIYLGRYLLPDETVDHIDRDFTNNSISNLRVISRTEHTSDDAKRVKFSKKIFCPMCGKEVLVKTPSDYVHNRRKGKAGGFCSKSCAGKYGRMLQLGEINPLDIDATDYREHYYIDKS